MKRLLAILATAAIAGCGSDIASGGETGGMLIISTAADADVLLPPLVRGTAGRQVVDQVFDRLADFGESRSTAGDAGYRPRLAREWKWSADSLSITFSIDPGARWHDGHPVHSRDVAFTLALYKDPLVYDDVAALANVDSVTTPDSLTATFWFARRHPEQFFSATYPLLILPEHLLSGTPRANLASSAFARSPVGSGPFRFARWEPGALIEIVADTGNYRGRPKLDRVMFSIATDPTVAVTRVISGEADFFEVMRPDGLEEMKRNPALRAAPYLGLDYAFIAFNFEQRRTGGRPHSILAEHGVRRALAMALNREAAVRNTFDTLAYVALGPFVRSMDTADTTLAQIPYDPDRARAILDSLGWRLPAGREVRERNGRKLELTLLVPSSSRPRQRIAILAKEDLRQIGVSLEIEQTEFTAFNAKLAARDFDLYFGAWHMEPSPAGLRQTWYTRSPERGTGGVNHGSYSSPRFDAAVDSALTSFDMARRRQHFRSAYQQITDDVAAIWMYEPRNVAAVHSRFRIPELPSDAWWARIEQWSVDPAQRIERDKIGIRAPLG